jgi:glycosyltransferase involved in cell wall biosynthesis
MKQKVVLYFCMITMNRAYESLEVVRNVYPYVDRLVIIDGGSTDGTLPGLEAIGGVDYAKVNYEDLEEVAKSAPEFLKGKMVIVNKPWCDNFPEQRNAYVETVGLLRDSNEASWICVSDSDEYFSERLRMQLKTIIERYAEPKNLTMLLVQARDVMLDEDTGDRVEEAVPDYFKNLIYKWNPTLKVTGDHVHEGFNQNFRMEQLPNNIDKGPEFEILYEHRKRGKGVVWERAHCRNFFIRGGGPNLGERQKLWKPFREMIEPILAEYHNIDQSEVLWHHYRDYVKDGNVDNKLKYWFIRYCLEGIKQRPKQIEFMDRGERITIHLQQSLSEATMGYNYDGASEVREGALLYFSVLHPSELPEELRPIFEKYLGVKEWKE